MLHLKRNQSIPPTTVILFNYSIPTNYSFRRSNPELHFTAAKWIESGQKNRNANLCDKAIFDTGNSDEGCILGKRFGW